jgi:hypothetical protein
MGARWSVSVAVSLLLMYLFYRYIPHNGEARIVDLRTQALLEFYALDNEKIGGIEKDCKQNWNNLGRMKIRKRDAISFCSGVVAL